MRPRSGLDLAAKRVFDVVAAALGLAVLSPLLLLIAIAVALESRGHVFYRGRRAARGGGDFRIFKFRTMIAGGDALGPAITVRGDGRVTRLGRILRHLKLDELPQLLNVVAGDMSLVGPRPEAPDFVAHYDEAQRELLRLRPGITSPASVRYRNEEELVGNVEDYVQRVMPAKVAIDLAYFRRASFWSDLGVLAETAWMFEAGMLRRLYRILRRRLPWTVLDVPVIVGAFYAATLIRFVDLSGVQLGRAVLSMDLTVLPILVVFLTVNRVTGLNRRAWRLATASDGVAIFTSAVLAAGALLVLDLLFQLLIARRPVPVSVLVLGTMLAAAGQAALRYRWRLVGRFDSRQPGSEATRTLIFGAGDAGEFIAWRLLTQREGKGYRVVGFIDDDPVKHQLRPHGLPVLGDRHAIPALVEKHSVELVILAVSNISGEDLRDVLGICQATPAKINIIPNLFDLITASGRPLIREVQVEDLLGRQLAMLDRGACLSVLEDRTILITGAAGSVGSELARQIAGFSPARLVLLDNNESGLHDLGIELRGRFPEVAFHLVIADVCDAERIAAIFRGYAPDAVFHAAAFKHVPLMEEFPEEAVRVNVGGTRVVLEAALAQGARRFVLVSTDKAVRPRSVMGATKRVAEMLVLAPRSASTLCTAVRFGNVIGSRGSVVPTFAKQIEMGGPVTVTHPEMTRFFMEISEAAALIIQAASYTEGQDLFMLEMGDRIRIDELARRMIRLRGLRPEVDIPIVYSGIRPGEKLHEELHLEDEERIATAHPGIYRLVGNGHAAGHGAGAVEAVAERLEGLAAAGRRRPLVRELLAACGIEREEAGQDAVGGAG
jgi:FlaA1/EpsC-like NDP-sugar epimerase/lipopolysaccharide/colanic/teichoic acid biosynthesis glycosyltransferase